MRWGGVIVAAGRGTRFGGPKQLIELAGMPMVAWSLDTFARMPEVAEIAIVTELEWLDAMRDLAARFAPGRSTVVAGGATRQQSVRNGLLALTDACDAAFVHDGARPLVDATDVRNGMQEVRTGRGAVLAVPVVDTIKLVDPRTKLVESTLDRERLWAAQTPQFAMRADFSRAHDDARERRFEATDDVALLERIGVEVAIVAASRENFKVTLPADAARAESLLRLRVAN